jgi:hypothetical protein
MNHSFPSGLETGFMCLKLKVILFLLKTMMAMRFAWIFHQTGVKSIVKNY